MNIIKATQTASEILATYSNGTLPLPSSVSVGSTFIGFNMMLIEDVQRWSEAVDVPVDTYTTQPNEVTGQTYRQSHFNFKHDELTVYVSYSAEVKD